MTTPAYALDTQSWKDLYRVAMCESDLNKLSERIATAEAALILRARQLSYTSVDNTEEQKSLDDAMCILHGLRSFFETSRSAVNSGGQDYRKSA